MGLCCFINLDLSRACCLTLLPLSCKQVRYHFDGGRHFTTTYPPAHSTATQQLPSGAWLLPGADGTWLAARPAA
jgi:hypothetical protein